MFFAGVLIAALSIAQEARANPVSYVERDEVPPHPEITGGPPEALGFWSTPAKNYHEWRLLNNMPAVGRRQVKSNPADLLATCGVGYVDCGNDYCCPSGNTCFTETLTATIKCNPISVGGLGNFGTIGSSSLSELISEYNSVKSAYPKLLSNFPDIATTGSFNYNSFVSQYYSALNSLTANPSFLDSLLSSVSVPGNLLGGTAVNTGAGTAATAASAAGGSGSGSNGDNGDDGNNENGGSGGSSSANSEGSTKTTKKKTNLAPIIGGAVGGVVVLALIGGLIAFFVVKNKKDKKKKKAAAAVGVAGGSPPSSSEKPGAYAQQASVPPTPGMGPPPMGQPPMGQQPPVGQYAPQPTMSPVPPAVSPIGVMGGLPAVPQPGQVQQTPSPQQYGNYAPPPSFSPPPPGVSPVSVAGAGMVNDPSKGYFAPGQQYAEMPGVMPGQQPAQVPYQDPQQLAHQQQQYGQIPSPGVPQPQGGQPPYYAQHTPQGPVAEMDASGGR